jgi:hypothetical protein
MQEIINFVQSVGFPIVIALLFYIDFRKVIKCNTQALDGLARQQEQLIKVLQKGGMYETVSG